MFCLMLVVSFFYFVFMLRVVFVAAASSPSSKWISRVNYYPTFALRQIGKSWRWLCYSGSLRCEVWKLDLTGLY
ncbi:uncharacterized protein BDZ83DRAFT_631151 [Colletotrichum acutatum]|uniref:Secreted protein n=1 Tax=Glomerella acutata TaxID=27357 RepID=A0AAD8UEV8_GLOAC|nr:uncharacterized protein BDZ83DRAFT_631151 [Colletotrichum acutatum]KAK1720227.1 hypothetical protein BDZ83DRAFT_631151 [Colletotrichum acutatum]